MNFTKREPIKPTVVKPIQPFAIKERLLYDKVLNIFYIKYELGEDYKAIMSVINSKKNYVVKTFDDMKHQRINIKVKADKKKEFEKDFTKEILNATKK